MGVNEGVFAKMEETFTSKYVSVNPETSEIIIRIQDGSIKEVGVNGVQIDMLGKLWLDVLYRFNSKFPCRENSITITKIEEALLWQAVRTKSRELRSVEGFSLKQKYYG